MPYLCLKNQIWTLGPYSLTPLRQEDVQQIRIWRNDQIAILRQKHLLTVEEQESYYLNTIQPSFTVSHPNLILFSFFENDLLIGYGGLVHIDWKLREAEISFILATQRILKDEIVPQAMSMLIHLLLQVAFHDMQLHEVNAEVYEWGTQRKRALEEAGFKETRKIENSKVINGKSVGSTFYSLKNKGQTTSTT